MSFALQSADIRWTYRSRGIDREASYLLWCGSAEYFGKDKCLSLTWDIVYNFISFILVTQILGTLRSAP